MEYQKQSLVSLDWLYAFGIQISNPALAMEYNLHPRYYSRKHSVEKAMTKRFPHRFHFNAQVYIEDIQFPVKVEAIQEDTHQAVVYSVEREDTGEDITQQLTDAEIRRLDRMLI